MEQELRTLFEIQQLDSQIVEWERRMVTAPRRIEELDQELTGIRDKAEQEKAIIEELEKERRKKEKDLEGEKEKIKKLEGKLFEVKTNKEYQALLKEIETLKGSLDKTEEEVILLMEQVEDLAKDLEAVSQQLKKREHEIAVEKKGLAEQMESMDQEVTELRRQRANLFSIVDNDLGRTYEMLREKRGGVAVVNVRDGVCMGCFMNIPPQFFIEVTKNLRVNTCPSCNRIFYYNEAD